MSQVKELEEMALNCMEGGFNLDIRKFLFTERGLRHWNKFPSKLVELPVEAFKRHLDVALWDMV